MGEYAKSRTAQFLLYHVAYGRRPGVWWNSNGGGMTKGSNGNEPDSSSGFACFSIETLGICACKVNGEGVIEFANERCKDVWGYGPEELVGMQYDQLIPGEENGGFYRISGFSWGDGGVSSIDQVFTAKGGFEVWARVAPNLIQDIGSDGGSYLLTVDNITEQRLVQEAKDWNLKLNQSLARLHDPLVDPSATISSLAGLIHEETLKVTGSMHGFVGSVDVKTGDLVVHTISKMVGKECHIGGLGNKISFPADDNGQYPGLWGYALNTGIPFYTNSPQSHGASKGIPEGHVPLNNYLTVPLFMGKELAGQIALANKPGGFDDRDLQAVKEFGNLFTLAISRIREKTKLEDSEQRYRDLVELMQEGLLADDVDGRVTYVNHQFCKMLGISRTDLVGSTLMNLIIKEDQALYHRQQDLRKEGMVDNYEMVFLHNDGHKVFTLVSPTPLFNEDGEYIGSFGVVTDITKLKQLESQLIQAQKLESVGQLAAGIAHEINTPTQYVDNNTRFLKTSLDDLLGIVDRSAELVDALKAGTPREDLLRMADMVMDPEEVEMLREDIPDAVNDSLVGLGRISEIVKSVKQLSHPGMKGKVLADINESVRSTATVTTNEWKYVADVDFDLDETMPRVPCLLGEFNQVLLNLIINAADAIRDKIGESPASKGRIHITTANKGGCVEVRVSDTGNGVPTAVADKIFDPFFTTKQVGKGTGQGLAISHSVIVEKHGGTLTFTTEENVGTTFILTLPIEESEVRTCLE